MSDHLSLFDIERALHELMSVWQEAGTPEEVEAAELAIRRYAELEVRRVDGIRRYVRACETMMASAKAEMNCQAQRVRMWEARRDRLKAFVFDAMESFGVKKLEGETGTLSIKTNGGKQAVVITDESLVPEEYMLVTTSMSLKQWNSLIAPAGVVQTSNTSVRPSLALIAEALAVKCMACNGRGKSIDLDTSGKVLSTVEIPCPQCNGLGTMPVAGARLSERGSHLEIR